MTPISSDKNHASTADELMEQINMETAQTGWM